MSYDSKADSVTLLRQPEASKEKAGIGCMNPAFRPPSRNSRILFVNGFTNEHISYSWALYYIMLRHFMNIVSRLRKMVCKTDSNNALLITAVFFMATTVHIGEYDVHSRT